MTKLKFLALCLRHSQFMCLVITDLSVCWVLIPPNKKKPKRAFKLGGGGIRTHGTLVTYDGFQDRSDKPLWHSSISIYQM